MDERYLETAELLETAARERAIARVAASNKPETHPHFDGSSCVDCDDEIPPARLAMGKVRCVTCQSIKERKNAHAKR